MAKSKKSAIQAGESRPVGLCIMGHGAYVIHEQGLLIDGADGVRHHVYALRKGRVIQPTPWERCADAAEVERAAMLSTLLRAIKPLYEALMREEGEGGVDHGQ